ncbi:TPA: hypothetical protein N0F65_004280, partial [Lagenidium giganteum]
AELKDISLACNRLWDLDSDRLEPGVHYELNLQEGKSSWQDGDVAADPLFSFVDQSIFERRTFKLFYDLLDNYERGTGIAETVTEEELVENNLFLNAVIESAPMQYAYNWLVKNKKFSGDQRQFKRKLDLIWFGLYRRQAANDSSGFEHVFVGEEKDGKVCGCHNWIQIYNEERCGRLDYRGFIRPKARGRRVVDPMNHEQLVTIQFMWDREIKPVSTSLIGVSPEFEMALYTLCFLNGQEDNVVQLGPYSCNIKCYSFGHGDRMKIGTAFPEALPLTEAQAAVKIQASFRGRMARKDAPNKPNGGQQQARPATQYSHAPTPTSTKPQPPRDMKNPWGTPAAAAAAPPAPSQPSNAATNAAPGGAWGTPKKWRPWGVREASMESKTTGGEHAERKTVKATDADDCDVDQAGAPSPKIVALRHGYNQTYVIRSSDTNLHEVLFRCGNWCYAGKVDLGSSDLELNDLPVVIPALQKQQGSLQYLCEWKAMPSSSPYSVPLETLYDAFDLIGSELASERIERKLMTAAQEHSWVDEDSDTKNFFELQSGGYECFDDVDLVASKTFVRGLILLVIYYRRSFYVVLNEGDGEQPLLDVRFPDLSAHLQGVHLQTYREDDCSNMKKLTLWQAVKNSKQLSPPKPVRVQCKDVSGVGYNQTFLIRRTPRVDGKLESGSGQSLREVLFRFGNWCYNGHVDLGPKLELADIPIIIPMLRRQQSALTFMCEVSKMPATSLFTPSMEHLADALPAIQEQLSLAETFIRSMAESGGAFSENASRIREWLEDDNIECFFEIGVDKCDALKDVEAIASKIYIGGVVLVVMYFDYTFYVYVENAEEEQPLLDTNFPDIAFQTEGIQVKTYRDGVPGCKELRRISLWKVVNEFQECDDVDAMPTVAAVRKVAPATVIADAKQSESRREEDVKHQSDMENKASQRRPDSPSKKNSLPHHIAPLKASGLEKLKKMPDLGGMKAPWDETGRPLGLRASK